MGSPDKRRLSVHDRALTDRPVTAPPAVIAGPPRRIVLRLHEWDHEDSRWYTVRFLIITERNAGWETRDHATRYRALPSRDLLDAALRAGLDEVTWHDHASAAASGFHQPFLSAHAPSQPAQ